MRIGIRKIPPSYSNCILLFVSAIMMVGLVQADDVPKEPLSCMTASPIFGAAEGSQFSDWKKIDQLTKDHVLTKIKVCTDSSNRNVLGLQLTYGGYSAADGAALEDVPLDSHGIIAEGGIVVCDTTELADGQYMRSLQFGYTSSDLVTLTYQIQVSQQSGGPSKTFGTSTSTMLQTPEVKFSPADRMFFGLNGRT